MAAPVKYATPTRFLHWIAAVMVIATLPIGVVMLQEGLARPVQNLLFVLHKNGGVIILLLVLARIIARFWAPSPVLPPEIPRWQARVARFTQVALYALLLIMAISGYVRVRAGGFPIEGLDALGIPGFVPRSDALAEVAKTIHFYARFPLIALIALHIAAGLKHLIARDGVFGHIWPPLGR